MLLVRRGKLLQGQGALMYKLIIFLFTAAILSAFDKMAVIQNSYLIESVLKQRSPYYYKQVKRVQRDADSVKEVLDESVPTVIYLTSASVPPANMMRVAEEAGLEGVTLHPVLRGLDNDVAKLAGAMNAALGTMAPGMREVVRSHTDALRVSPRLFRELNATQVPLIVVASCKGGRPYLKYCTIDTVARGETTLRAMAQRRLGADASAKDLLEKATR